MERLCWGWRRVPALVLALVVLGSIAGCSDENPFRGDQGVEELNTDTQTPATPVLISMNGNEPPDGLVTVAYAGGSLQFWPYTGSDFSGTPQDPVNLIFAGKADPVQIRSALLRLDGNRTAFGFPDSYPFNATWSDANGDVQTSWAEARQWVGSVVQLQLGSYGPLRVHLRLLQTDKPFDGCGRWTLGQTEFEVVIPGTADHQVLSWELAEQLVTVDLIRTGLLDPAMPPTPTDPINAAPSFREIPDFIYNGLPPELVAAIGGPPQPVSGPVGIGTDGRATIFHLVDAARPVLGLRTERLTMTYDQIMPRPLCAEGPLDWVYVQGPVVFEKTVNVDKHGRYTTRSSYSGTLTITPMDMTASPPVPSGPSFTAEVGETQHGFLAGGSSLMMVHLRRVAHVPEGDETTWSLLKVSSPGMDLYQSNTQCH